MSSLSSNNNPSQENKDKKITQEGEEIEKRNGEEETTEEVKEQEEEKKEEEPSQGELGLGNQQVPSEENKDNKINQEGEEQEKNNGEEETTQEVKEKEGEPRQGELGLGNQQVQTTWTVGLWFSLRSAPNRKGETLPQLPRQYIRVKEENMTVLTVKKYLVTKFGLESEAEIDLSCMGRQLLDSQTLKYARDIVWRGRLIETLTPSESIHATNESAANLVMPLHYAKHCVE
ncbi:E3 ubiquitin protein ligase DRIP2-like [Macadamia integrifolia]|uniref:E3 ubiquitin protein ligase DRIP2-like n=1 Tax=Macadamia integrifolia TaxID=60698 RepID=UPI001C4EF0F3|nr:E3 ubiquitin protein ligase DRIP2-like [Macadamia integrifolia]